MARTRGKSRNARGFTIIELLVVLFIISILAMGFGSLGPKSPSAVKAGLMELKGALHQARALAMSTGKPVTMVFDAANSTLTFRALNEDGTFATDPALGSTSVSDAWSKHARFSTALPLVAGENQSPNTHPQINFNFKADGWDDPLVLDDNFTFGFSPIGRPEKVKVAGNIRTPLLNGMWIGVVGSGANKLGPPYGVVLVNDQGMVTSFFKPDSIDAEFPWRRMD